MVDAVDVVVSPQFIHSIFSVTVVRQRIVPWRSQLMDGYGFHFFLLPVRLINCMLSLRGTSHARRMFTMYPHAHL